MCYLGPLLTVLATQEAHKVYRWANILHSLLLNEAGAQKKKNIPQNDLTAQSRQKKHAYTV